MTMFLVLRLLLLPEMCNPFFVFLAFQKKQFAQKTKFSVQEVIKKTLAFCLVFSTLTISLTIFIYACSQFMFSDTHWKYVLVCVVSKFSFRVRYDELGRCIAEFKDSHRPIVIPLNLILFIIQITSFVSFVKPLGKMGSCDSGNF